MSKKERYPDARMDKLVVGWQSFDGGMMRRRQVNGKNFDYWPTTGRWSYNGQYSLGGAYEFLQRAASKQDSAIVPTPVKNRSVNQEYISSLKDDLYDAEALLNINDKPTVRIFVGHLKNKLKNCEVRK